MATPLGGRELNFEQRVNMLTLAASHTYVHNNGQLSWAIKLKGREGLGGILTRALARPKPLLTALKRRDGVGERCPQRWSNEND